MIYFDVKDTLILVLLKNFYILSSIFDNILQLLRILIEIYDMPLIVLK